MAAAGYPEATRTKAEPGSASPSGAVSRNRKTLASAVAAQRSVRAFDRVLKAEHKQWGHTTRIARRIEVARGVTLDASVVLMRIVADLERQLSFSPSDAVYSLSNDLFALRTTMGACFRDSRSRRVEPPSSWRTPARRQRVERLLRGVIAHAECLKLVCELGMLLTDDATDCDEDNEGARRPGVSDAIVMKNV